ncbi:cytochrome c [bacterium]|nr:cytochrome c [bacterium]
MKLTGKMLVLGLVMIGGIAYAASATDPDAKARQELMDANGAAAKTLAGMASGKVAFDAAAAAAAKQSLVDDAAKIPVVFKNQSTDPASKAKPDIWTSWDDFAGKAKDLGTTAAAMDTSSADGIKAGLGAIGGACSACHTAYKAS